jgi:iron complex outermembrane receptor protein
MVVAVACSAAAVAQSPPESLAEVVVTARRASERLDDVPLAIDALPAATLAEASVFDLGSLAARSPGLYFESMWGGFGSSAVIRGQSQPTFGGDNVGVFVDGVYQANRTGIDVELLDLERVEVVRGPQSALFGHSSFAGAIHYVPRAPSATLEFGATAELGSDDWRAATAHVGGPLGASGLRARAALSWRDASGTNRARAGGTLGDQRRRALSFALQNADSEDWQLYFSARVQWAWSGPPPVSALTYVDYNCGSFDQLLGAWSYYCGAAPVARQFDVSAGVPDGRNRSLQLVLRVARPLGDLAFESDTTFYRARTSIYRDFDGSSAGATFGVCDVRSTCAGPTGVPRFVDRLVQVNSIFSQSPDSEEISQDFRLRGEATESHPWMIGLVVFRTRDTAQTGLGFAHASLQSTERLVAYLPAAPLQVGPVSVANRALVADPNFQSVDFLRTDSERRTLAVYARADWHLADRWSLQAEGRATWERLAIDGQVANFAPGFGRTLAAVRFRDVTPRAGVTFRPMETSMLYLSMAKGSRSGGINAVPGLDEDERSFEPEYNWTYELGSRISAPGGAWRASGTLYYIEWRDTQITGLSTTPGTATLVTRNTAGLTTRGVELEFESRLGAAWSLAASVSYADPRFRAGSEDPGSGAFCGITALNSGSSFCSIGPTRDPRAQSAALVPYIDGNLPQRSARLQWTVALRYAGPAAWNGWAPFARADAGYQDDVYDRAINGVRFGERTVVDVRAGLRHAAWSIELWGRNLGDERYVRAAASRLPQFFPTTPRPLDLVHGDGRRFGITVRYED